MLKFLQQTKNYPLRVTTQGVVVFLEDYTPE